MNYSNNWGKIEPVLRGLFEIMHKNYDTDRVLLEK